MEIWYGARGRGGHAAPAEKLSARLTQRISNAAQNQSDKA